MLKINESPYFFIREGILLQALAVYTDASPSILLQELNVKINGVEEEDFTTLTEGVVLIPVPGAVPNQKREYTVEASFQGETLCVKLAMGNIRPFTIYVAQDKHLDYGWKHTEEEVAIRMHEMMDFYVNAYNENGDKYNFDCLLWLEQYVSSHTEEETQRLMEIIRNGGMGVGAFPIIPVTGILTGEEMVQAMLKARRFAKKYNIPIDIVIPNEAPSMSWGLASCLAGMGIKYLARGAYELANPYIKNRDPIPVYYWEGQDGGRVLVHFAILEDILAIGGYSEARPLRVDGYEKRISFVEHAIETYEGYCGYELNSFMLLGSGWDEYPRNRELSKFISHFNSIGFAYPRLVDSNYLEFFADVEKQLEQGKNIPVLKGDYGSGWEIWGSQLAYPSAVFRKARRCAHMAQAASAISSALEGRVDMRDCDELDAAFDRLIHFADHNFGGILPTVYDDMRDKKLMYAQSALQEASGVLERGLGRMKTYISGSNTDAMVFNPLGEVTTGVATVRVDTGGVWQVFDAGTSEMCITSCETAGVQDEHYVSFLVKDIPAYGIKGYSLTKLNNKPADYKKVPSTLLENDYFRLEFDTMGQMSSMYSKVLRKELLNGNSSYAFNGLLYEKDGTVQRSTFVELVSVKETELCIELTTNTRVACITLETVWSLPKYDEYLKVTNYLTRDLEDELSSVKFSFPLAVEHPTITYDGAFSSITAAYVKDGGSLLQGASTEMFCALSYVDMRGSNFSASLVWEDSFMFLLDSVEPGTVFSLVHSNATRNDFIIDQGGQRRFCYTYYLHPYEVDVATPSPEFFSRRVSYPLQSRLVSASCPQRKRSTESFALQGASGVVIATAKIADARNGVILRLRELDGKTKSARLCVGINVKQIWQTNMAEERQKLLIMENGLVELEFKPYEIKTLLFSW